MVLHGLCGKKFTNILQKKHETNFDESYYYQLGTWAEESNHLTPIDSMDMTLLEKALGNNSKVRIIPYGLNEAEQWHIFNILTEVFRELETGETIYLDVTHAFRSLPIFSLTSLLYLQDVLEQSITLKGIYYGMLETSREFDGKAPIIDLSLVLKIQEWIKGAHSFLNYGRGYLLADLMKKEAQANILRDFSDALSLNYLTAIEEKISHFETLAKNVDSSIAKMILPPILLDFTKRLTEAKTHAEFQLQLSIWHREKKNYATAFLVYIEALTTHVCEKNGLDWKNYHHRKKANYQIINSSPNDKIKQLHKRPNFIRNNIVHSQTDSLGEIDVIKTELILYQTDLLQYLKK